MTVWAVLSHSSDPHHDDLLAVFDTETHARVYAVKVKLDTDYDELIVRELPVYSDDNLGRD